MDGKIKSDSSLFQLNIFHQQTMIMKISPPRSQTRPASVHLVGSVSTPAHLYSPTLQERPPPPISILFTYRCRNINVKTTTLF